MRLFAKIIGVVFVFCGICLAGTGRGRGDFDIPPQQDLIATTLINLSTQVQQTSLDCSHFVHRIFDEAGLLYRYEPSTILYRGAENFIRVRHAKPGDLIVWRGHVGIVVDPAATTFVSKLREGVRISSYHSRYWERRGTPRFFRYTASSHRREIREARTRTYTPEFSISGVE